MKKLRLLSLIIIILLSAVGCGQKVGPFQMNSEIPYASYCYNIERRSEGASYNVTATGEMSGLGKLASGYHFVTGTAELEDFAAACEARLRRDYADDYNWPGEEEKPNRHEFPSWYGGHTQKLTFDETFFASQDLLIVDYCGYGYLEIVSRPEEIRIENSVVNLKIFYGYDYSTTADNCGNILLIPVPKGCNTAVLEFVEIEEWCD